MCGSLLGTFGCATSARSTTYALIVMFVDLAWRVRGGVSGGLRSGSRLPGLRLAISAPSVALSSAHGALPGCVAHRTVLSTTSGVITPVEQFQATYLRLAASESGVPATTLLILVAFAGITLAFRLLAATSAGPPRAIITDVAVPGDLAGPDHMRS